MNDPNEPGIQQFSAAVNLSVKLARQFAIEQSSAFVPWTSALHDDEAGREEMRRRCAAIFGIQNGALHGDLSVQHLKAWAHGHLGMKSADTALRPLAPEVR